MDFAFSDEQRKAQIEALKAVLEKRLRVEVDDLDAELIVSELKDTIGVDAYNQAVLDAQTYMAAKLIDLGIDVYAEAKQTTGTGNQVTRKPNR